jgi:hypothetical protein
VSNNGLVLAGTRGRHERHLGFIIHIAQPLRLAVG